MARQKVTIEVDIPDGYEATGEFRPPKGGEYHLSTYPKPAANRSEYDFLSYRIILRKKFEWPSWLKAAAIARDIDGVWWFHNGIPVKQPRAWCGHEIAVVPLEALDISLPDVPWEQSLIVNPSRTES